MVCCLGSFFLTFREMFVPDNLNQSALLWLRTVMSLSVQVKLKQNVKWRHFFAPDRSYLCVLDLVFQRLLQEVEGIFLSVGLDHDVPCLSHLDLEPEQAQEKYMSVSVTNTHTLTHIYFSSSFSPPSLCTSLPKTGSLSPSPASVPSSSSSRCWAECWFSEDPRCWPAEHASQTCSRRGEKKNTHIISVEKKIKRKLNILKLAEK